MRSFIIEVTETEASKFKDTEVFLPVYQEIIVTINYKKVAVIVKEIFN
jgi:hypothetical protein